MRSRSLLDAPVVSSRSTPAILSKGFRPFFLLAALYAALSLPLWVFAMLGSVSVEAQFSAPFWHAHEMLFGFAVAVIAGFLLTAVGNWTGRETATGPLLGLLGLLWILGRIAIMSSAWLPARWIALIDSAFIPALGVCLARPIVRAKNRRNYVFLALLTALFGANLAMHASVLGGPAWLLRRGSLVGVEIVVVMIVVISGRVVPMFTRNAIRRDDVRSLPALDRGAIVAVVALLLGDIFGIEERWLGWVALIAGLLVLARARHWGTLHTFAHPLCWVLHVACGFVALGLIARFAGRFVPALASSTALHAMTAGGIGLSTLGMMARVTLGHTGRMLVASRTIAVAFVLATLSALVRVVGPLLGSAAYLPSIVVSGTLFATAFGLYLWIYLPQLTSPRVDGKPG